MIFTLKSWVFPEKSPKIVQFQIKIDIWTTLPPQMCTWFVHNTQTLTQSFSEHKSWFILETIQKYGFFGSQSVLIVKIWFLINLYRVRKRNLTPPTIHSYVSRVTFKIKDQDFPLMTKSSIHSNTFLLPIQLMQKLR